jgi:hypothetical protein
MSDWFRGFIANTGALGEIFVFLWTNKRWWLMPMVALLLLFGLALVFANASGIGPLIYTLF